MLETKRPAACVSGPDRNEYVAFARSVYDCGVPCTGSHWRRQAVSERGGGWADEGAVSCESFCSQGIGIEVAGIVVTEHGDIEYSGGSDTDCIAPVSPTVELYPGELVAADGSGWRHVIEHNDAAIRGGLVDAGKVGVEGGFFAGLPGDGCDCEQCDEKEFDFHCTMLKFVKQ